MWYIMTAFRLWAAAACIVWGSVQAMLNLGFDGRSPLSPLVIALVCAYVLKPDNEAMAQFVALAQAKQQAAENARRAALEAHR